MPSRQCYFPARVQVRAFTCLHLDITAGKALELPPRNCDSDYHPDEKFE